MESGLSEPTDSPDYRNKAVEYNGKLVKLQVWDTVGQEKFDTITSSYYRGAQGLLLVFDVSNAESFNSVAGWEAESSKFGHDLIKHKVLVGNKTDKPRVVSEDVAQTKAAEMGYGYVETCAAQNQNVEQAFMMLVDLIKKPISVSLTPGTEPTIINPQTEDEQQAKRRSVRSPSTFGKKKKFRGVNQ
eukprot:TRINITY_DN2431_c0_g1_i31.p1 TRINITY_DN2431_c0_g1~~TRINITY_DN2431_c0_g1_i31.p1  ORF type:complete len:187 (-),score=43.10 TRINITY_DN2431_c0_g1_i31:107-667(-)